MMVVMVLGVQHRVRSRSVVHDGRDGHGGGGGDRVDGLVMVGGELHIAAVSAIVVKQKWPHGLGHTENNQLHFLSTSI